MSTIDTKRLRALAEKATPGPWEEDDNQPFSRELQGIFAPDQKRYVLKVDFDEQPGNPADAEFIAATDPKTVLALLDEIDRYRGTLARILGYTRGAVRRLMPEELAELERERRSDD